jgi:4Fe-4S ferredoxin
MTTRGTTIKRETSDTLTLSRPMVTRRYELVVDQEKCCGCEICEAVCPREAISLTEAVLEDGRVTTPSRLEIDEKLCSFCGECAALCPTHAIAITVNGEPEIPVIKGEAFPMLIRNVRVHQEPLQATTDTAYVDDCPVEAIDADVERDANDEVVTVDEVEIDKATCINCTRCMETGPEGGFEITKPYRGRTYLHVALCPDGCQACADVCPSNAITYDGERVWLDERFCLYCGACERVCPAEGAIEIRRSGFVHTDVESGAWANALEKLVSFTEVVREFEVKRQRKRRKLVFDLLLNPDGQEPSC